MPLPRSYPTDSLSADEPTARTPTPTPQQVRRALARAERGAALDLDEATVLLSARGRRPRAALRVAARVRDAGLAGAGRPGVVTYSPKVFIPVTRLCRDRCHYCTFVETPGHARPRGPGAVPLPRRDPRDRPPGCRARLHRGAVHPRRPARGPLARGAGLADARGLRLDAGLRAGDGDPGARGDRAAAAPQPRRDVVGGDEPAQAGLPLDGDDARDHLAPALRDQGRGPLRLAGQGPRRTGAGARGRRPPLGAVHHRPADRHRREPHRARRVDLRAAPRRAPVRPRAGSDHPELPRQARHRDAPRRRPRARGVPRHDRRLPHRARPEGAAPGAAQPGRPRGVPRPARRRRRRLGRRLPADPRPREPRAPLALPGAAALDHRRLPGSSSGPG